MLMANMSLDKAKLANINIHKFRVEIGTFLQVVTDIAI